MFICHDRLPLKVQISSVRLDLEYANSHCESYEMQRFHRTCVCNSEVKLVPPGSRPPSQKTLAEVQPRPAWSSLRRPEPVQLVFQQDQRSVNRSGLCRTVPKFW